MFTKLTPELIRAENHGLNLYLNRFVLFKDEESDDEPAVLSLPDMSPTESILLDEELLLDQIKDLKNQDKPGKTESAVLVTEYLVCASHVDMDINLVWAECSV